MKKYKLVKSDTTSETKIKIVDTLSTIFFIENINSILVNYIVSAMERLKKRNPIYPIIVWVLSLTIFSAITIVVITYTPKHVDKTVTPEIAEQISELSQIEKSLNNLQSFVTTQKESLTATENTLTQLQAEKAKLEAAVNIDKKTVDAIFKLQEERANKNVWKERLIGFISGIISSVIASILFTAIFRIRNKGKQTAPEST